ncbi:uncharacterized protein PV09_01995 [Verruconis gallopava]|uniref:Amidase domain-containing protein n=1 Tax=Verruconis gallopava TaxID=253628 RepID=A0A0D1Z2F8_9PEZI|nr:uncharacterized protein PV09_01995 [Verruconis gallopava]KIW07122.1 hypothetical protein PV09_01995 [Verruconis gallopava]
MHDYLFYPRPKETVSKERPRKEPSNPVLRGTLVKLGAKLLPLMPGLPATFYKNAGFPSMQKVEGLDKTDARYEPTVIPCRPETHSDTATLYVDPETVSKLPRTAKPVFYSILDYYEAYKSGKTTPTEVVEALLPIIRRDIKNPTEFSTAWFDLNIDLVKAAAAASTERWKQGKALGVLDGVPVSVKDEADLKGYYKKCLGSKVIFDDAPDETSWSVIKWEEQGAIILGKLSMHEIGMDTSNNNPHYGAPINPYNKEYYTGGSSGGSASAVAAGILPFALGCDGGGSIRIPSSWCGIYGLKTSHGWVSTRPYESRARSTAVAGPMAANMLDLEVAWRVMAQPDPEDLWSRLFPMPSRQPTTHPKRIGIYKNWFNRADRPVRDTCQKAVDYFKETLGYEVVDITIPYIKEAQLAHALTILNEATSTVTKDQIKLLTPPNQILLTVGRKASCADFLAAQRIRTMIMEHLAFLFKKYPGLIIVLPTTPNPGWPKHKKDAKYGSSDGNRSIRNMENVWMANFTGIPSITFPVGYVDPVQGDGKFPVGLMGAGEWGSEERLLEFGYEGEKYLNEVYEGGRLKPKHFVDVMELVEKLNKPEKGTTGKESINGAKEAEAEKNVNETVDDKTETAIDVRKDADNEKNINGKIDGEAIGTATVNTEPGSEMKVDAKGEDARKA